MATPIFGLAEANALLKARFRDVPCWLSWHVTDPTRLGDIGSEVGGGGYTRQRVLFGDPNGGSTSNTNSLIFSNMPPVTLKWLGIWSAQYNGLIKFYVRIADMPVPDSQQVLVAPGDVAIGV